MGETQPAQEEKKMSPVQMTLYGLGIIIVLIAIAFILPTENNTKREAEKEEIPQTIEKPKQQMEKVEELKIEDIEIGTGKQASEGAKLVVHYTGTLTDGTVFDSSRESEKPFAFTLGEGLVIEGWEKGLVGMRVGGTRKLTIPSDMAYGEAGAPPVIGPNETLIFEVELLEIE